MLAIALAQFTWHPNNSTIPLFCGGIFFCLVYAFWDYVIAGYDGFSKAVRGICLAFISAVLAGAIGYYSWTTGEADQGFLVSFPTEFIDLSRSVSEDRMFWIFYPPASKAVVYPVALTAFIEVTNLYPHPVEITKYNLSMYTYSCGWIPMRSHPVGGDTELLWGYSGTVQMPMIDVSSSLDNQWKRPIESRKTARGMLLFDPPSTACTIVLGTTIKLRLELTDSVGITKPFDSPVIVVSKVPDLGDLGRTNEPLLNFIGYKVDTSQMRPTPDNTSLRGEAFVVAGNHAKIALPDGAYLASTATRPPK